MIYPDGCEPTREVGCLFFSHSEFMAVASKVAWIMRNGLFIILSDNGNSNNLILRRPIRMALSIIEKSGAAR